MTKHRRKKGILDAASMCSVPRGGGGGAGVRLMRDWKRGRRNRRENTEQYSADPGGGCADQAGAHMARRPFSISARAVKGASSSYSTFWIWGTSDATANRTNVVAMRVGSSASCLRTESPASTNRSSSFKHSRFVLV